MRSLRRLSMGILGLILILTLTTSANEPASPPAEEAGQKPAIAAKGKEFVVEAEMPYRANLRATGIFINAHHLTKPAKEVVDAIKAQDKPSKVTVIICRGDQMQSIRDFKEVCDEYIFESLFLLADWTSPFQDTLLWPGVDHPMINNIRKIRMATMGTRTIASVPMTSREIWGVPRERPELFDELKWMTVAIIGADYDGIIWGHVRREEQWNEMLQELTDRLKLHAADLGAAAPVNWVKAPAGQPTSTLASDNKLFIALLNPDFMKVGETKKQIEGALTPGGCKGTLTLNLPNSISADTATTLYGTALELTPGKDGLTCSYDFSSGGELIIVTIKRGSVPPSTPKIVGPSCSPDAPRQNERQKAP